MADLNLVHTANSSGKNNYTIAFTSFQERTLFASAAKQVLGEEVTNTTDRHQGQLRFLVNISGNKIEAISNHIKTNDIQPDLATFLKRAVKEGNGYTLRVNGGSKNVLDNLAAQLTEHGYNIEVTNAERYEKDKGLYQLTLTQQDYENLGQKLELFGKAR